MYRGRFISVTNRIQCENNFLDRVEEITRLSPYALILREKDLSDDEYKKLAVKCMQICERNNVPFFCNDKIHVAEEMGIENIQLSFKSYFENKDNLQNFKCIGVSIHSVEEVQALINEPISHIIAGHIYATDCKKGLAPRGTDFLKAVCEASPKNKVFGIGGINADNYRNVYDAGAYGFCIMSGLMKCKNAGEYMKKFE